MGSTRKAKTSELGIIGPKKRRAASVERCGAEHPFKAPQM
jgi:hypothetical protein